MKNRHFLLVAFLLVFSVSVIAQNKIGDNPAVIQTGSLLELESLTKGLRLPRIPLNDVTKWTLDGSPASGMVIFNDNGTVPHGLYCWNTDTAQWDQVTTLSKLISELAKKEDITNKSTDVTTDATSDSKYPSVKAVKTYVDAAVTGATIPDADAATKGKIQLAGDLSGTADLPTVPELRIKENVANRSTDIVADAATNTKYPGVKAIKDYVDVAVAGATIADADAATKGKIQLAGDLSGTAAAPTVPGLLLKEDLTNKSTNVTADGASNTKYPGVKAIKDYVDVAVAGATIADADAATKGKIQLAGDLSGTAAAPTVPGLALKVDKTITVNGQALSANVTLTKTDMGLSNADNTSDVNKPISTATQTALNLKADKSITVNGQALSANVTLTKTDVGLSNADNTSDASKPISTLTQAALDLKAPLVSPALTGTPTAPTAAALTNNTEIATTAFVTSAVAAATPDATNLIKGKIQLTGDLGGTATTPTVPGLLLKEDLTNKTTSVTTDGASDTKYPSAKAVKTYVDAATPDATTLATGKIQLAGDLSGTAIAPTIANGAVTSAKLATDAVTSTTILDGTIAAADLGANAVTTAKITDAAVTTAKLETLTDGNIIVGTATGNAKVPVTGDVTMANTGATTIAANAVTTTKIIDAAVTNSKLATAAVTGDKIAQMTATDKQVLTWDNTNSVWKPTTVTDSKVQVAGTVDPKELNATDFDNTGADIAIKTNAVTTTKINNAAVTVAKLETLTDGNIIVGTATGNAKVPVTGDVTMANTGATTIAANAVTTAKINDAAVTLPKMANVAATSLIGNSTGAAAAPQAVTLGAGLSFNGTTLTAINTNFISMNATTYTVTPTDYIIKAMSGSTLVTLPNPATSIGRSLIFIEGTGAGVITFDNGLCVGATQSVGSGLSYLMVCDGTNWRICAQ